MFLPAMVLETEPYKLADLPALVAAWLQSAGGFAAVGVALATLAVLLDRRFWAFQVPPFVRKLLIGLVGVGGVCYALVGLLWFLGLLLGSARPIPGGLVLKELCLIVGGACAILAALLPLVVEFPRFRAGRIWALTLLTFREAVRRQVFWAYSLLIVVGLFANWFIQSKPEGQLQTYVTFTYLTMLLLLLVSHVVLASFSIPTDVQNQTIHTILTKPVERFEVVLGRFFGYCLLMSVALFAMTTLSLLYVYGYGVHPDAEKESLRARVPIYGDLKFMRNGVETKGESVGREWEYRQWVAGGKDSPVRAEWLFRNLPSDLTKPVPCEFNFDLFRMTKGEEGKGVFCSFAFITPKWDESRRTAYNKERDAKQSDEYLAQKYGFYEVRFLEIANGHTFAVDVPAGLFQTARETADPTHPEVPLMKVSVKCESPTQFIGVARHDLYMLDGDGGFLINFYKGAVGTWLQMVLVIGVAVAASTYLTGVISLVCVLFLYGSGWCRDFIMSIAEGKNEGGGPSQSFYRLVNNQNMATPLPDSVNQMTVVLDEGFRWILWRFLNLAPDLKRFNYSGYIGSGFNVSFVDLTIGVFLLLGYLLPWLLLSYYLIKSREVAAG